MPKPKDASARSSASDELRLRTTCSRWHTNKAKRWPDAEKAAAGAATAELASER